MFCLRKVEIIATMYQIVAFSLVDITWKFLENLYVTMLPNAFWKFLDDLYKTFHGIILSAVLIFFKFFDESCNLADFHLWHLKFERQNITKVFQVSRRTEIISRRAK